MKRGEKTKSIKAQRLYWTLSALPCLYSTFPSDLTAFTLPLSIKISSTVLFNRKVPPYSALSLKHMEVRRAHTKETHFLHFSAQCEWTNVRSVLSKDHNLRGKDGDFEKWILTVFHKITQGEIRVVSIDLHETILPCIADIELVCHLANPCGSSPSPYRGYR